MGCSASLDARMQDVALGVPEAHKTARGSPISLKNGALEGQYEGDYVTITAAHPAGRNGIIRTELPDGKGRFTYLNGATYFGFWKRARRHGVGTWRGADGVEITAQWDEDTPVGIVEFWREHRGGGSYLWRKGTANEFCQLHGSDEDCFELDPFERTKIECTFVNGIAHGPGRMLNRMGRVIREGDWVHGVSPPLKQIRTADYPDGSRYEGDCKDEGHTLDKILRPIPHGRGRILYWSGDNRKEYAGEWWEGLFHGQGALIKRNGEKYVGQFEYGQEHGEGVLYNRQGVVISEGEWREGSLFVPVASSGPRQPRPQPVIERPSAEEQLKVAGRGVVAFPFRQTSNQLPPLSSQASRYVINEPPPPPYEP